MRNRLSYANVAATLALVFAMSGGALAASHYLISSTRQISPKVLKKLRGARGATGPRGATGAAGSAGASGQQGASGTAGKDGATGREGPAGAEGSPAAGSLATAFVQMSFGTPIKLPLLAGNDPLTEPHHLVLSTKTSGGGKNLVLSGSGVHLLTQATVQLTNPGPERSVVTCSFARQGFAGGGPVLFGRLFEVGLASPGPQAPVPFELSMTASVSLVGGETYDLQLRCGGDKIEQDEVNAASLNAVAPG